eukprot:Gb_25820 [translate_table: standard]
MVTGVPVNPGFRLGIVTGCSWFVADGAPQSDYCRSVEDHILLQTLGLQSCEIFEGEEQWLTLVESEVFEGISRFDGRKLEEVSHHHQLQPTEVAWRVWWFTEKCLGFVNGNHGLFDRDGKTSQILAAMASLPVWATPNAGRCVEEQSAAEVVKIDRRGQKETPNSRAMHRRRRGRVKRTGCANFLKNILAYLMFKND